MSDSLFVPREMSTDSKDSRTTGRSKRSVMSRKSSKSKRGRVKRMENNDILNSTDFAIGLGMTAVDGFDAIEEEAEESLNYESDDESLLDLRGLGKKN